MGNDVTLPSGVPPTLDEFQCAVLLEDDGSGFCMFLVDFAIGGGDGRNKPIDITHDISPHLDGRPSQPKIQRRHSNVCAAVD
jgi:hypothetical protein